MFALFGLYSDTYVLVVTSSFSGIKSDQKIVKVIIITDFAENK